MDRQQHKAAAMVGGLKVEFKWDQQQNGRASEMFFFPSSSSSCTYVVVYSKLAFLERTSALAAIVGGFL